MIVLAATVGVAYVAGVYDDAATYSCIQPASKPFGHREMLPETGPHVISGENAKLLGASFDGVVNLALLKWCPFGVGNRLADLHRLTVGGDVGALWYATVADEMGAALDFGPRDRVMANGAVHSLRSDHLCNTSLRPSK